MSVCTQVQPLRWWSAPQLAGLALRFERVTRDWCVAWGIPVPVAPAATLCRLAHECTQAQADDWRLWAGDGPRQVWLRANGSPAAQLMSALFNPATTTGVCPQDSMASQLVQQAWSALQEAWRGVCGIASVTHIDEAATELAGVRAWTGAVILGFEGWVLDIQLFINPECASELMDLPQRVQLPNASLPPVTDFFEALHGASLPLWVALSDVEIELGSLQTLAPGDVIRLPHLLDVPLNVYLGDGDDIVCTACLGQRQGRRAVELQRSRPDLTTSNQEHP